MTFEEIKSLIQLVNKSDLAEFVFEDGDQRIVIRTSKYSKNIKGGVQTQPTYLQVPMPTALPTPAMSFAHAHETESVSAKKEESTPVAAPPVADPPPQATHLIPIKSPMVGTFYRASSPDKPSLAKIGDVVQVGSPVCIIEAMKLFNEIESEVKGKIVKVLIEDATPVEYEQILFMVDPAG